MNDYQAKQEARRERYERLAEQAQAEADRLNRRAHDMAQVIPLGQPILVGHHSEKRDRNYRSRIDSTYRRASEAQKRAEHYRRKAAAMDHAGISSDDPDAPQLIEARIADLEGERERMKAVNAAWRQAGRPGPEDGEGWRKVADHPKVMMSPNDLLVLRTHLSLAWLPGEPPFPRYALSNIGSNIRRLNARLQRVQEAADQPAREEERAGVRLETAPEDRRVRLFFPGKPPEETRRLLKSMGFRWAPSVGAWQRQLTPAGLQAAEAVLARLEAGR